jgi:hypothetical protein
LRQITSKYHIIKWAKVNHEMNNNHFDNKELDESMASELLKSLGILDNEDDLNEAKISLNNDISSTNDIVKYFTDIK